MDEIARESLGISVWKLFADKAKNRINSLTFDVRELNKLGKRVAGYGASAKSTVWISACGFGVKDIECVYDNTPYKQWTYSPGTDIPIRPSTSLLEDMPDCCVLFAWNYAEEIALKESSYLRAGGKFIVPK